MADPEAVSTETAETTAAVSTETAEVQPTDLEVLAKHVEETVNTKVAEKSVEVENRFKSVANKDSAEYQRRANDSERRAQSAEQRLESMRTQTREFEPEVRAVFESADQKAQLAQYQRADQERLYQDQQRELRDGMTSDFEEILTTAGIPADHKELDWANDAPNPREQSKRFNKSVAKISSGMRQSEIANTVEVAKNAAQEALREAGIGKIDVSGPSGASGTLNSMTDYDLAYKEGRIQRPEWVEAKRKHGIT